MKGKKERWLLTVNIVFLCLVVGVGFYIISQPSKEPLGKTTSNQSKMVYARTTQTGAGLKELEVSKTMLPNPVVANHKQGDPPLIPKKAKNTTPSNHNEKGVNKKADTSTEKKINGFKRTIQDQNQNKASQIPTASSNRSNKQLGSFHEIYNVPRGYCALTFDDGPSVYTEKIAQLLKNNKIPATFFFIGQNVIHHQKAVSFANNLGFGIGDHSYSHPQLNRLSENAQASQILQTKKLIEAITNKPVTLFRPPYGAFNNQTKDVLVKNNIQMVLWNSDPRDWATKSPTIIVQRIARSELSGKVIILHDQKQTWEALPQILKVIKAKGLKVKAI
jgi:peptidoglycan/xylan/chitin deacetylase (PgdA/CDA1 family)